MYEEPIEVIAGNNSNPTSEDRFLVNHGEAVTSLRTLLRRSSYVFSLPLGTDTTSQYSYYTITLPRFPPTVGYDTNGWNTAKGLVVTGTTFPFTYTRNTPYTFLQFCFVGRRGSSHYHINAASTSQIASVIVARDYSALSASPISVGTLASGQTGSQQASFLTQKNKPYSGGMAITNQFTQSGISVHMPMYNTLRMIDSDPNTTTLGAAKPQTTDDSIIVQLLLKPLANTLQQQSTNLDVFHSVGTDFTFLFFLNVPTFAVMSGWPTPV